MSKHCHCLKREKETRSSLHLPTLQDLLVLSQMYSFTKGKHHVSTKISLYSTFQVIRKTPTLPSYWFFVRGNGSQSLF